MLSDDGRRPTRDRTRPRRVPRTQTQSGESLALTLQARHCQSVTEMLSSTVSGRWPGRKWTNSACWLKGGCGPGYFSESAPRSFDRAVIIISGGDSPTSLSGTNDSESESNDLTSLSTLAGARRAQSPGRAMPPPDAGLGHADPGSPCLGQT